MYFSVAAGTTALYKVTKQFKVHVSWDVQIGYPIQIEIGRNWIGYSLVKMQSQMKWNARALKKFTGLKSYHLLEFLAVSIVQTPAQQFTSDNRKA